MEAGCPGCRPINREPIAEACRKEGWQAVGSPGNPEGCGNGGHAHLGTGVPLYSSRNVFAGSMLAILSVGNVVASSVTDRSVSTTARMVGAS